MRQAVLISVLLFAACAPQPPPIGLDALKKEKTWNQAREVYFHSTKTPAHFYKVDGEKGEIVDVHVYKCRRSDLVLVTYGETYYNTTGWDVHVALMKTNDVPAYPGNIYVCPIDSSFAVDWQSEDTLVVFYPAGYYPDKRDYKTREVTKSPDFQYEKKVNGVDVKFLPADRSTMETKREAMKAKELTTTN
jgi:hypothetical protein